MKLLDIDSFSSINALWNGIQGDGSTVYGRVEAYSCKMVTQDKKLAKKLQGRTASSPQMGSVPLESPSIQPFPMGFCDDENDLGSFTLTPLAEQPAQLEIVNTGTPLQGDSSTDTDSLVYLITALNVSFTDHDFTDISPSYFCRELPENIKKAVDTRVNLMHPVLAARGYPNFATSMWSEIDRVMKLDSCDYFTFNPPAQDSPFEDASWCQFVFILNKATDVNKIVMLVLYGMPEMGDDTEMDMSPYSMEASPCDPVTPVPCRDVSLSSLPGLDIRSMSPDRSGQCGIRF
eukprot:TRINITY_DN18246_c0_g1_i1.p1 TRINITY_DN18246_c0_g1~~TRINITY_DN18246_c0_g1_i1.p1  ORF type:complete len:290 (+),score=53.33 TRINITY_DN18246_c0_g1_i1:52-921(+)